MEKKFCPKCKSKNIQIVMTPLTSQGVPPKYKCKDCRFESYIIIEQEKNKK